MQLHCEQISWANRHLVDTRNYPVTTHDSIEFPLFHHSPDDNTWVNDTILFPRILHVLWIENPIKSSPCPNGDDVNSREQGGDSEQDVFDHFVTRLGSDTQKTSGKFALLSLSLFESLGRSSNLSDDDHKDELDYYQADVVENKPACECID